jgi:protein-disulfide isomerase
MKQTVEVTATLLIAVMAVLMTSAYFLDRRAVSLSTTARLGAAVDGWQTVNAEGHYMGPAGARMVITEFMDFTCPFCRDLVAVTDSMLGAYGDQAAIVFHHFPLRGRDRSIPLAIEAECASRQGRFEAMYRVIYRSSEIEGTDHVAGRAAAASIPDTMAFRNCTQLPVDSFPQILKGKQFGERHGVTGTPTLWINGRPFAGRTMRAFEEAAAAMGLTRANPQ